MNAMSRPIVVLATMIVVMLCTPTGFAHAQGAYPASQPLIVAAGTADVLVPPTTASFSIGMHTTGASASAASGDNARLSKAVTAALLAAGVSRDELVGSRLNVGPRWTWDQATRQQRRAGFEATNTIRIETDRLDKIGMYLDAALNAGATDVSDISFTAKNSDVARHQALAEAVANARVDAEAMAKAGGGNLGELLLLSTEPTNFQPGVGVEEIVVTAARRAQEPVGTSVTPSQIKVSARVVARWKFVPLATTH
jgi:uncharacterized protein YggE